MDSTLKRPRGLGLCSGGLDSILSALVLQKQGVYVEWVNFETPFFSSEKAGAASEITGVRLTVRNITPVYLDMLRDPKCGYGKNMNPCMDCHALMFSLAGAMMKEKGFDFLFSGEVLGQRPMSQTKNSLRYVEKNSGFDGYIVRPLSAKRLPETIPEKTGLLNRDMLLDLSGRSRKPQMKMAQELGITDYPAPAGGCLLTDKGYSIRLRDLFDHQNTYPERALHLLRYGRHFRPNDTAKIIVGRTRKDNENILKQYDPSLDTLIRMKSFPGPVVLIPRDASREMIRMGASLCVCYSKAPGNREAEVNIITPGNREVIRVSPADPEEMRQFLV